MIKQLFTKLSEFVQWPQMCVGCELPSLTPLCEYCLAALPYFELRDYEHDLQQWPAVAKALSPHDLAPLHACCRYEAPVSHWVQALKFHTSLRYANVLAAVLAYSLQDRQRPLPQALLAAPLHRQRYAKRQFNQAIEIANALGGAIGVDTLHSVLSRPHATRAQSELSREERLDNVANAFVAETLPSHITHIALIDDVITTGATMQAMLSAVKTKNPNVLVEAWCVALVL
ncbi:ComF family protein [Alteromonas oceanisediminis]|uniref:ComF family protein n=1 Tax=Alteromonas oceanisediminis TaxID=2836180 RepID=UPI001BDB5707|nr:hypothetical protein [Alteromonas oceanisediminis]MBT0587877.1 hypothetical protein [Alteromonas oceanisediminis]